MIFAAVIATELVKLRRSRVTWISFGAYAFIVAMVGFLMWILKNPAAGESLGLLGQKATLTFGNQPLDWNALFAFIVEMGGIGGLIMCSVVVVYVFGREYAEGTAKNMLALPVSRVWFVLGKITVSAAWFAVVTLLLVPEACAAGAAIGLGRVAMQNVLATAAKLFAAAGLSFCCAMLAAWVAVESRGYFAALGFTIFTAVPASVFGRTGWGPWVPWSIVGLFTGAAGPAAALTWGSIAVVLGTFVLGAALVIRHEVRADNVQ